jgi:hypothetical protein
MTRNVAALILLLSSLPLCAQDMPSTSLRHPGWEISPWVQGGTGIGEAADFKFVSAGLRVGRILTGEIGDGRFRGTFEMAADIMPVYAVSQPLFYDEGPSDWIYGFALNPLVFKWNWTAGRKLVPYFAAEGGMLISTRDVPEVNSSSFNFLPGAAFGIYLLRSNAQALDLSVHATHISNASIADNNPGINTTLQFRIGYTWFK